MKEELEEKRARDWNIIRRMDGVRLAYFDDVGIPEGLVVNGELDPALWKNISLGAVPLRVEVELYGEIDNYFRKVAQNYGEVVIFFVRDETEAGGSWGPILEADLRRVMDDKGVLLEESSEAVTSDDRLLAEMKRLAYAVMVGDTNTKSLI